MTASAHFRSVRLCWLISLNCLMPAYASMEFLHCTATLTQRYSTTARDPFSLTLGEVLVDRAAVRGGVVGKRARGHVSRGVALVQRAALALRLI